MVHSLTLIGGGGGGGFWPTFLLHPRYFWSHRVKKSQVFFFFCKILGVSSSQSIYTYFISSPLILKHNVSNGINHVVNGTRTIASFCIYIHTWTEWCNGNGSKWIIWTTFRGTWLLHVWWLLLQKVLLKKPLEESPSCECEDPDEEEKDATPTGDEQIGLYSAVFRNCPRRYYGESWQKFSVTMKILIPLQLSLHSVKEKREAQTQHTFSSLAKAGRCRDRSSGSLNIWPCSASSGNS